MTVEDLVRLIICINRYKVFFFGTNETGTLTTDCMWQYTPERKAKHMKHMTKEFYSDGMNKIERESQKIVQVPGSSAPQVNPTSSPSITSPPRLSFPDCNFIMSQTWSPRSPVDPTAGARPRDGSCGTSREGAREGVGQGVSRVPPSIGSRDRMPPTRRNSRVGGGVGGGGFMDSHTSPRSKQRQQPMSPSVAPPAVSSSAAPLLDIASEHLPNSICSLSETPVAAEGVQIQVRRRACGDCSGCRAPPCGACTPCKQKFESFLKNL